MSEPIVSTLRVRIGQEDAHNGGNLVDGAHVLTLFGDVVTEIAIITDGDEGLFVGYDRIEFLAPVHAGDFLEVTGTVTRIGGTTPRPRGPTSSASRWSSCAPSARPSSRRSTAGVRGAPVTPAVPAAGRRARARACP